MPKRDYRRALEEGIRDRVEGAKRIRHEFGLSTTDEEIEERAREQMTRATERALRDVGED